MSDADETTVDLTFNPADSPYTTTELQAALDADVAVAAGKMTAQVVGCGVDCATLRFEISQSFVQTGSAITIDLGASNAAILDALGLDRPTTALGIPRATGVGGEFPYTSVSGEVLTLTIENGDPMDPPETYDWTMGADLFNAAADFVATHGGTHPEVTIVETGGELRLTVVPVIAGPYIAVDFSGPADLLDRLGLDASADEVGAINFRDRNTLIGDWRIHTGQAIAAYLINELTRDPAAPGPDPFPNIAITGPNEAALETLVRDEIDPYRLISVIFLDAPPGKRAGAWGNYIPIGIENGGFRFEVYTNASLQIQFDFSADAVMAHETGHNIELADLYNNSNGEYDPALRYPESWDVMDDHADMSHTGAWHKEIDSQWLSAAGANMVTMPEPSTTGAVNTERFVLTPLEMDPAVYDAVLPGVPAGRTVAKAIRLPLGLGTAANDHFMLVQNRQPGAAFSQDLPARGTPLVPGGVYLTDAISRESFDFFKPEARNFVHPLTDEPVPLTVNAPPIIDEAPNADVDFLATYPAYDGLNIDIVGEIPGPAPFADRESYLVDVTREQKDFLELGITPWGAPPWESLDIWVEHGDKGVLSTVPLAGNGEPARWAVGYNPAANGGNPLNWIRVKVTNSGNFPADHR